MADIHHKYATLLWNYCVRSLVLADDQGQKGLKANDEKFARCLPMQQAIYMQPTRSGFMSWCFEAVTSINITKINDTYLYSNKRNIC